MPNADAILFIAVGSFFLVVALIFLPDMIAECRGVKIKPSCEFGGEGEDLIVVMLSFPFRLLEAFTAKTPSPDGPAQAIDGTRARESEGNTPQPKP